MESVFTIEQLRPIRDGFTISRDTKLGNTTKLPLSHSERIRPSARKAMTV